MSTPRRAKPQPVANSVLAALPPRTYRDLLSGLEPVALVFGDVLYEPGAPIRALVQGDGTALRMNAARFRKELQRSAPLQRELYRYTHSLMAQITQTAACNRFHMVPARLARWLLMTRDRVRSSQFYLTHEFLAHMLGVRRVGVTEAASALQRRKLIAYRRGNITILDHGGLETASCQCYAIVKHMRDGKHKARSAAFAGRA